MSSDHINKYEGTDNKFSARVPERLLAARRPNPALTDADVVRRRVDGGDTMINLVFDHMDSAEDNIYTALFTGVIDGEVDDVRFLARIIKNTRGEDINHQIAGYTALSISAWLGRRDIAEILIQAGASMTLLSLIDGYSPLHLAIRAGHVNVCKLILKHGGRNVVDQRDENRGFTPLMISVQQRNHTIMKLLVSHGADVSIGVPSRINPAYTEFDYTALRIARMLMDRVAVEYLTEQIRRKETREGSRDDCEGSSGQCNISSPTHSKWKMLTAKHDAHRAKRDKDDELKQQQEDAYSHFLSKVAMFEDDEKLDVTDLNSIFSIYELRIENAADVHRKKHIEDRRTAFMDLLRTFGISHCDLTPIVYIPPKDLNESLFNQKNTPKFSPESSS